MGKTTQFKAKGGKSMRIVELLKVILLATLLVVVSYNFGYMLGKLLILSKY